MYKHFYPVLRLQMDPWSFRTTGQKKKNPWKTVIQVTDISCFKWEDICVSLIMTNILNKTKKKSLIWVCVNTNQREKDISKHVRKKKIVTVGRIISKRKEKACQKWTSQEVPTFRLSSGQRKYKTLTNYISNSTSQTEQFDQLWIAWKDWKTLLRKRTCQWSYN